MSKQPGAPESSYPSPREALRRLLYHFWAEHTDDEAFARWTSYVAEAPDQAALLLDDLEKVLQDPPADLVELLQQDGEVYLEQPDGEPEPLGAHVDWLRSRTARLREIYLGSASSPEASLTEFLRRFWLGRTETTAAQAWSAFVQQDRSGAGALLQQLELVAARPPADLADRLRTHGWVDLTHHDASMRPYTPDEVTAWLARLVAGLRAAYDAAT
jgi:hypothetical protein